MWNCGRERCPVVILLKFRHPRKFRDLLHAANVRHGTDGFISPPKEGVLRNFSPGLNPQTWALKASTLPLDHRRPYTYIHEKSVIIQLNPVQFDSVHVANTGGGG